MDRSQNATRSPFPWPVRKIPLERVSLFAGNLATCLGTGVDLPRALRTCTRPLVGGELPALCAEAIERVQAGDDLATALQPVGPHLPPFFLPVLRCGEQSGRLSETLRYLEGHCRLLAEPARKLKKTWLYPLVIIALGWVVELLAHAVAGSAVGLLAFLARSLVLYGGSAVAFLAWYRTPPGRWSVDRAKLSLPLFGPVERHLAVNRFFHVFNLLYCTGGTRVEQMLKNACQLVTNVVLQEDLARTIPVVQQGGTLTDAFARPDCIALEHKALIMVGEEGGALAEAFARISDATAEAVDTHLTIFNKLFYRLVMPPIILSLVLTAVSLMRMLLG